MKETTGESKLTPILLSVLTGIAVISALKASYSVMMPLAFALFLITLSWPLYKWFKARLPKKGAFPLTLLALLGIFAIFVGLLFYSGKVITDAAPRYAKPANEMWQKTVERAKQHDVTLPDSPRQLFEGSPGSDPGSKARRGASVAKGLLSMVALWLLTFGLLALGLHEAPKFREKLQRGLEGTEDKSHALRVIDQVVDKCGRYFWTRTVVSAIQGICTFLAALALGLDMPFIWGLTAALLNYIPTVGSMISVVPPALFALFQTQEPGRAALVFFVMCFIQLGLGTFVDPLLEGRQLQISSFVVLFSIAFWGWVWGVAGALIGVPLTVTLLILCSHFEGTKWIADLFTEGGDKEGQKPPEHAT